MTYIAAHMIAFGIGFLLDEILGDPYFLPHPIRLIGRWIAFLDRAWNPDSHKEEEPGRGAHRQLIRGRWLVAAVLVPVVLVTTLVLCGAYWLHLAAGIAVEAVMTYQILAVKCLRVESMKVHAALMGGDLEGARKAVSMIVGRDTEALDTVGVARAAIETVAENTSDGAIAPMLYLAMGGPVFGFFYKAVNTMDSMVGYQNERYLYFGRAAAHLDDVAGYVPARVSALLMVAAAYILEYLPASRRGHRVFDARRAWRIYRRDRYNHKSPNSAQSESACAGALGIQLAGDARYFGELVHKPTIGDADRPVETEDIRRANWLLYGTSWLCEILCLVALGLRMICTL